MGANKQGFYLKELRLIGENLEPAVVTFEKGLNVIYGPSDTGKTFIFQCIEFLLGRSTPPKNIPEARKYTAAFLEIQTYFGEKYTIERSLKGGNFKKYDVTLTEIDDKTEYDEFSDTELSNFLLSLGGMTEKKARKNKKGETKNITFRVLHNFSLLGEIELQSEMSPIQKEQYTDKTYLENVFKYLITGQDDSSIIAKVDKNTIANRKAKAELLDELISSSYQELEGFTSSATEEEIENQLKKLGASMRNLSQEYDQFKVLFDEHHNEKKKIESSIREKRSRIIYLDDLLKRANILSEQYESDIGRLRSTIEASLSLNSFGVSVCPVCHGKLDTLEKIDTEKVVQASHAEIEKIASLFHELTATKTMFGTERASLQKELDQDLKLESAISETIESKINNEMARISEFLNLYGEKRSVLSKAQLLIRKISKYKFDKKTIEKFLEKDKDQKSGEFREIDVATVLPISNIFESILREIKFPDLTNVSYSENAHDFVINDKNRQEFGKGYRAITYAVFIASIMKLLKTKTYQIGLTVFDSPLVTYKKPKMNDSDLISVDLAQNFYLYLRENFNDLQVIVIENTPPKNDQRIHQIEFTKNDEVGRYGFIPRKKVSGNA